jgi:hypothetical protein
LADLLRRTLFNIPNVSGKIAAIKHRSRFKLDRESGQYIGFELGADITSSLNLDDYMVVENSEERAENFFGSLVIKHVRAIAEQDKIEIPNDNEFLIRVAFTQNNVFREFVKATEGVPRDAMHILGLAAQKVEDAPISMQVLRVAAYSFFQSDKYNAIQSNSLNRRMLDWIRDEVIGNRRTRAFLLPVGVNDPTINRLFDLRALHILKKNISSAHRPGERFVVYKLDYGCYVELAHTQQYPEGLLFAGEPEMWIDFDVPEDDARSYRRAILDLEEFHSKVAAA